MLDKTRTEYFNIHFQDSVSELERTIKKAQLIRKIDLRSRQSENATPEELTQILNDLKSYREEIRLLGKIESQMLILSRNIGESLMIGDDIKITILGGNKGHQVRICVEAPRDISVHGEEVYERIQDEGNNS